MQDVAGGRKFRGASFKLVTLRGTIQFPSTALAEPKLQKLVVHFRSGDGPRLSSVEVRPTSNGSVHMETNIRGDYGRGKPSHRVARMPVFQPITVGAPLVIDCRSSSPEDSRAAIQGLRADGVEAEFARKPLGTTESATTTATRPPLPGDAGDADAGPEADAREPPPASEPPNPIVLSADTFATKGQAIADANLLVARPRDRTGRSPAHGIRYWNGRVAGEYGDGAASRPWKGADRRRAVRLRGRCGVLPPVEQQR